MGRAGAVLLGVVLALACAATSGAQAPSLQRQLGPGTRVAVHAETNRVRFVGSAPGRPIDRPAGTSARDPARAVARAFLERHGDAFGIADAGRDLAVAATTAAPAGRSSVRFQQTHDGVPVLGGELVVNLDDRRNVLSVSGEALAAPAMSTAPRVDAAAARRAALAVTAKHHAVAAADLTASAPELWIHDSRLLGGPGLDRPTLVWRTEVTAGPLDAVRELVLVDARLGNVVLHFNQIAHALDRRICDAAGTAGQLPCAAPVRMEGGAVHVQPDVNEAYDHSGDTYDFFAALGRDSLDGAGMPLVSTVRFCENDGCPYENAFWTGEQMVYGPGFAAGDDVVGHELAHGVTEFSSGLYYYYQSGAINESLSDVFGELIDLGNGEGTDTPAVRWQIAEDVPIGAIRDMADPPAFGQPDSMTSPRYTADPLRSDEGGVHTNSGVGNKAAFLIADGGTFNGRTVTGLGLAKTARIYYEVATGLLTSASDYQDLSDGLAQACANLVGAGDGITAADCAEVRDAALATEMHLTPPAAPAPDAPVCPAGVKATTAFADDLENPASGRWARATAVGPNHWFYPAASNPFFFDARYATSGTHNFWGYARASVGDFSIAMTSDVTVPAAPAYLHFRHAYSFERSGGQLWDGGVVEYSTNGGASWQDAGPLFTHNGYDGPLAAGAGNPLAGRGAFGGTSNGYLSSRVTLAALAGRRVRFRFRIGTDQAVDDYGWWVDDVRLYRCGPPPPPPPPPPPTPPPDDPGPADPDPPAAPRLADVSVDRCRRSGRGRGRRARIRCRLAGHEAVARVKVRIKRGRRVVARRTLRPRGNGVLKLNPTRRLRRGRYVARFVLRDADGGRRTLTVRFRVR